MSIRRKIKGLFLGITAGLIGYASVAGATTGITTYATGDTDDGARSYKVALEGYDTTNGVLLTEKGSYLVVTTGTLNPINFQFTMTNGQFRSATDNYYLAKWVDSSNDGKIDDTELTPVTNNSGIAVACGAVAGALVCDPGDENGLHLGSTASDLEADSQLVIIDSSNSSNPVHTGQFTKGFNFSINQGLSNGDTVSVTVVENQGSAFEQTATTTLAEIMPQYCAYVSTSADAVIDVGANPSRTQFESGTQDEVQITVEDRNAVDTSASDSCGDGVNHSNTFVVQQSANGGSVNDVTATLCSSNQAIDNVQVGSTDLTYDSDTGCWTYTCDIGDDPTFTITVNGNDAIDTRSFTVGLVSVPASTDYETVTYLSDASAGSWTLNGYQAILPYQNSNSDNYGTYILINNASNAAGNVYLDIIATDDANNNELTSLQNIQVSGKESVDSGESLLLTPSEIQAAAESAGLTVGTMRYAIKVTVNAPVDQVHAVAFQKDGENGKRTIPMYTNADERKWRE